MTWYVILFFAATLTGMAISVAVFGTGGKRKRVFRDIYFSVEDNDGIGVIYTKTGEYSAVLEMENPVQKYSADADRYYDFCHLLTAVAQTLGEGYAIHKQDVFSRRRFSQADAKDKEFLSRSYFAYFEGRPYTDTRTYLVITQESKKGKLYSFDMKKWKDFLVKIRKVKDQLRDGGLKVRFLTAGECDNYVDRYFAMDFDSPVVTMNNFKVDDESIGMGDRKCRVFSLVDVDCAGLPSLVRPFANVEVNNTGMPLDLMSAIDSIPEAETVIYNQMIFIPNQKRELSSLEKKKNRHASIPNPSNQIAVEDIRQVQEVVAREGKQLVYTHFNLVVCCPRNVDMQKPVNHLENMFGRMGIHISKRAYNQLELFVNSFPGNCYGMNPEYDRFAYVEKTVFVKTFAWDEIHDGELPVTLDNSDGLTNFRFMVSAQSNVRWDAVKWSPILSFTDSLGTRQNRQVSPDYTIYANHLKDAPSFVSSTADTVIYVKPVVTFSNMLYNGELTLTVKTVDRLLGKKKFAVTAGAVANDSIAILKSDIGTDKIWFELFSSDSYVGNSISDVSALVSSPTALTYQSAGANLYAVNIQYPTLSPASETRNNIFSSFRSIFS